MSQAGGILNATTSILNLNANNFNFSDMFLCPTVSSDKNIYILILKACLNLRLNLSVGS